MNIVLKRKNFFLVLENVANKIDAPILIISSGYTSTIMAQAEELWLFTQLRTIPKRNRKHLPDPLIVEASFKYLYAQIDCSAYRLYLTPECESLKDASEELAELLETQIFKQCQECFLVGHSKGGVLFTKTSEYLKSSINLILVAPTYGTIMGDEKGFIQQLEQISRSKFLTKLDLIAYEMVMKLIGSRRPVDKEMSIDSNFVNTLDFRAFKKHNVMLIVSRCPKKKLCNPTDAFFRHYGRYFGLDKDGDGMVSVDNQLLPIITYQFVDRIKTLEATHPTVFSKSVPYITGFISDTLSLS